MQISEEIIKTLDYIGEKFGLAIDWTSSNVMPYFTELCNKIVKYEICTSIIWIVIFAVAITLCVTYIRKSVKWAEDKEDWYWLAIILLVVAIGCGIGIIVQIFDIVECSIFPEKYLAEYFMKLLKGAEQNGIFKQNA